MTKMFTINSWKYKYDDICTISSKCKICLKIIHKQQVIIKILCFCEFSLIFSFSKATAAHKLILLLEFAWVTLEALLAAPVGTGFPGLLGVCDPEAVLNTGQSWSSHTDSTGKKKKALCLLLAVLKNGRGFESDLHKYQTLAESPSLQGHYRIPNSTAVLPFKLMLFPGWHFMVIIPCCALNERNR